MNATYKFSVVLPAPYRKSARLSLAGTSGRPESWDVFTARTDADEATVAGTGCQTACPISNYIALVQMYGGAGSQTPRQWYSASGGAVGETIADVTIDGRAAIKVTNGTYPLQYVAKDGDRMFRVAYQIYPQMDVPVGATKEKLEAILTSFHFTP